MENEHLEKELLEEKLREYRNTLEDMGRVDLVHQNTLISEERYLKYLGNPKSKVNRSCIASNHSDLDPAVPFAFFTASKELMQENYLQSSEKVL